MGTTSCLLKMRKCAGKARWKTETNALLPTRGAAKVVQLTV